MSTASPNLARATTFSIVRPCRLPCRRRWRVSSRRKARSRSTAFRLTVNEVKDDVFSVLIIPHTLKVTTLGALQPGARVNIEVDQMARYAARLLETLPR